MTNKKPHPLQYIIAKGRGISRGTTFFYIVLTDNILVSVITFYIVASIPGNVGPRDHFPVEMS